MKTDSWGIAVMRLQVPDLHDGHRKVIDQALSENDNVLIFIGVDETRFTDKKPLDYDIRKGMLEMAYPQVGILPFHDCSLDDVWSKNLDAAIIQKTGNKKITLYGSRDSFLDKYTGNFPACYVETIEGLSGSDIRADIRKNFVNFRESRIGIIYASEHHYPIAYPTVDIAILSPDSSQILLARKKGEKGYRYVGGFFDPKKDSALEDAAYRELGEEAPKIRTGGKSSLTYVASRKQKEDWRYAGTKDCIMTTLFKTFYKSGALIARDDIEELRWFPFSRKTKNVMVLEHQELYKIMYNKNKIK